MHHVGFVEDHGVDPDPAAVFDMQHGRLGKRGQQLVRRLGAEDGRIVRLHAAVFHAEMVPVYRVEFGVGIPGFVEVQVFHALFEPFLDLDRVVADTVVSGIGQRGHLDFPVFRFGGNDRAVFDFRPDGSRGEFGQADRADDAAFVPARDHIDGQGARDGHGVIERLVAVAVHQCEVAADHPAVPDDLVHGRGAVQHIVGLVRAEDLCRIAFGVARRALVVQQRAEFGDRDRKVRPEHVFPEEFEERDPGGTAQESLAAQMAGRVPRVFVAVGILHQLAEEVRIDGPHVCRGVFADPSGQELGGVGGLPEAAVDFLKVVRRQFFGLQTVGHQQDRYLPVADPESRGQFRRIFLFGGIFFRQIPVHHNGAEVGPGKKDLRGILVRK